MTTTAKMKLTDFAHCQFGLFSVLQCGESELYILEPPALLYEDNGGHLPAGIYDVIKKVSPDGDVCFIVAGDNSPGGISFAQGNILKDTSGELLVGTKLIGSDNLWGVGDSEQAMAKLNAWLDGADDIKLYIDRKYINQSYNN